MNQSQHEIEMADLILDELANDGLQRSWIEIKRQAALRLEAMGLSETRANFAITDAIRYRGEGLLR